MAGRSASDGVLEHPPVVVVPLRVLRDFRRQGVRPSDRRWDLCVVEEPRLCSLVTGDLDRVERNEARREWEVDSVPEEHVIELGWFVDDRDPECGRELLCQFGEGPRPPSLVED